MKEDLTEMSKIANIDQITLELALINSTNNIIVMNEGIEGFAMIRKLTDINELIHWHLKPEHSIILKSLAKSTKGPVLTMEKESNTQRIKILEQNGFKKINESEGIFKDEKAIILKRG